MIQVAGCFCEWAGRVLLLLRAPDTAQGSTWCLPGGKLEPGESPLEAALRETREEAGILLPTAKPVGEYQGPGYTFHMFHSHLPGEPAVKLDLSEHTDYRWVTPKEALALPLIEGGDLVFQQVYPLQEKP